MKRALSLFFFMLLLLPIPVRAAEGPVPIHTAEDLMAMEPTGSYILMEDLDLSGISWQGIDFQGTLDGNGHAILNLSPSVPGEEKPTCYDGNLRTYEPEYVGLFSTLKNAEVKNLSLINVRTVVETEEPCFLGAIAGYSEGSSITGCNVSGCLELRAYNQIFGVSGVIGYGDGTVEDCNVDVTLICVDTDSTTRDEQFLGGIYGSGFFHVRDCQVTIDGYVSEHGYCHNGGIGGMHKRYPVAHRDTCEIMGNTVTGKITFYEHNHDRRAYCDAVVGEYLEKNYMELGNTRDFLRDETWNYNVELRPCMCEDPRYDQETFPSDCSNFGYTVYTCQGCGYTYRDQYTLKVHTPGTWTVTRAATREETGLRSAVCTGCDYTFTEIIETLPPAVTPSTSAPTVPTEEAKESGRGQIGNLLIPVVAAAIWGVLMVIRYQPLRKKGKFLK